jgi:hypothetical protein
VKVCCGSFSADPRLSRTSGVSLFSGLLAYFSSVPLADRRSDGIQAEQVDDTIQGPCWLSAASPGDFIQPADGTVIWRGSWIGNGIDNTSRTMDNQSSWYGES